MSNLLCSNCHRKFDRDESYTTRAVHLPAYLAKSNHGEDVTYRYPVCPNCGSDHGFVDIELALLRQRETHGPGQRCR